MSRIACLLALFTASLTAAPNLELYFIDVESGKSVLLVSPSGKSMLFDVGWPAFNNRRASTERTVEAVQAAGLKRIDFLVISHFDVDHLGDVPRLAAKIPVGRISITVTIKRPIRRRRSAPPPTRHYAKRSANRYLARFKLLDRLHAG